MYPQELKAIIFDMDGVLVDSEPLHLLAMQKLLQHYEIDYSEHDNREFLGKKDLVIFEILIDRFKLDLTPSQFVDVKEELMVELIVSKAIARPGVDSLLERARSLDVPMAVASSATLPTINLVVDTLNIRHYFKTLCSGDQVRHGKPAPDVYLLAAEQIGVAPKDCLVIEDTITGLTAGKAAGMFCVSIPCEATAHQDHSIADLSLSRIDEIPVEKIFAMNKTKTTGGI